MRLRTSRLLRRGGLVLPALACLCVACAPAAASELRNSPIVKAVAKVRASVVNIHGEKNVPAEDSRPGQPETMRRVNGMGTGVIIDPRGYIVTNHHVVDGVPKITVTLADETEYTGRLIMYDAKTDLAIVKIDASRKLPVMTVGTSADLMPGETVIAVGNAYGYMHTVTDGIVSALHRSVQVSDLQNYEDLIQTDASINPGNSGGPLLNIDGEMIGINVAVRAGAQGIGFAIPSDKVMAVAADLMSARRTTWHGAVVSQGSTGKTTGLEVRKIDDDSPAAEGGLQSGDVITGVDEQKVCRALDLERALIERKAGDEVKLTIQRSGQPLEVSMVLAAIPEDQKRAGDPSWDVLGLRLDPVPNEQFQRYGTRYHGGLAVMAVRPDSPAAKQGIRRGDVLVGMHVWETTKLDDVSYVLNRPDFSKFDPLKFYILRGKETLYGHLVVSHRRLQQE
jgi:serine protease Do